MVVGEKQRSSAVVSLQQSVYSVSRSQVSVRIDPRAGRLEPAELAFVLLRVYRWPIADVADAIRAVVSDPAIVVPDAEL